MCQLDVDFATTISLKSSQCGHKAFSCDDFRGIPISPIISKVFEHRILKKFQLLFTTPRSQFDFKKGTSCNHVSRVVRNTVCCL